LKHSRVRGRGRRAGIDIGGIVVRSLALLALVASFVLGAHWLISDHVSNSAELSLSDPAGFSLNSFHLPALSLHSRRVVYPYSVVPGGVTSAAELRQVAAHDGVVAQHYSGFDYNRAHVVQVTQPKLVYLSYRRGDHVYWSSKQASLHVGETLLTDGKITARTRCGNQVSVLPQANTSPNEPMMSELDRPDAVASGMERFPGNLASNLFDMDPALPIQPTSHTPGFYGPPGVLVPFPVGGGGTQKPKTPGGGGCSGPTCDTPVPPPPPAPVPEPATIVLLFTGGAAVLARMHSKKN
jgi:hypothetical protein